MNKLLKLLLISAIALAATSTVASADASKGQKLYLKKLKGACTMNGAKMAAQHTQGEWEASKDDMATAIKEICPTVKDKALKGKYLPHYYDFFYEYANDSGNVPSC